MCSTLSLKLRVLAAPDVVGIVCYSARAQRWTRRRGWPVRGPAGCCGSRVLDRRSSIRTCDACARIGLLPGATPRMPGARYAVEWDMRSWGMSIVSEQRFILKYPIRTALFS